MTIRWRTSSESSRLCRWTSERRFWPSSRRRKKSRSWPKFCEWFASEVPIRSCCRTRAASYSNKPAPSYTAMPSSRPTSATPAAAEPISPVLPTASIDNTQPAFDVQLQATNRLATLTTQRVEKFAAHEVSFEPSDGSQDDDEQSTDFALAESLAALAFVPSAQPVEDFQCFDPPFAANDAAKPVRRHLPPTAGDAIPPAGGLMIGPLAEAAAPSAPKTSDRPSPETDDQLQGFDGKRLQTPASDTAAAPPPTQSWQPADYGAAPVIVSPTAATELNAHPSHLPAPLPPNTSGDGPTSHFTLDTPRLLTRVARAFAAAQQRDGELHMKLSPPELGSLWMDVRIDQGALSASLQTETEAARVIILENLPALRDRLAEQGLRIERFNVDLMQRRPGEMHDRPGRRQHESPTPPLRFFFPALRDRTQTAALPMPRPRVSGTASGLNVIV